MLSSLLPSTHLLCHRASDNPLWSVGVLSVSSNCTDTVLLLSGAQRYFYAFTLWQRRACAGALLNRAVLISTTHDTVVNHPHISPANMHRRLHLLSIAYNVTHGVEVQFFCSPFGNRWQGHAQTTNVRLPVHKALRGPFGTHHDHKHQAPRYKGSSTVLQLPPTPAPFLSRPLEGVI